MNKIFKDDYKKTNVCPLQYVHVFKKQAQSSVYTARLVPPPPRNVIYIFTAHIFIFVTTDTNISSPHRHGTRLSQRWYLVRCPPEFSRALQSAARVRVGNTVRNNLNCGFFSPIPKENHSLEFTVLWSSASIIFYDILLCCVLRGSMAPPPWFKLWPHTKPP